MDVGSAIAVSGTAVKLFRELVDLAKDRKDAAIIEKVGELQTGFLEIRQGLIEAQEEIRQLREHRDAHKGMVFYQDVYWLEVDGRHEGPFCPKCLVSSDKRAPLADYVDTWRCTVCDRIAPKSGVLGGRQTTAQMD